MAAATATEAFSLLEHVHLTALVRSCTLHSAVPPASAMDAKFEAFKANLLRDFVAQNKDKMVDQSSLYELVMGFYHAVKWSEVRANW